MKIKLPINNEAFEKRTLMNRFWGSNPDQHYYAKAKNLVIRGELTYESISQIKHEYGDNLLTDFSHEWIELLEEVVYYVARDGRIQNHEKTYLNDFIEIFEISKEDARKAYLSGSRRAYMDILTDLCSDDELSNPDLDKLEKIANHFGLTEHQQTESLQERLKIMVQQEFDSMSNHGMISDAQWEDFEKYSQSLRVDFQISESGKEAVEFARNKWRVIYGQLNPIKIRGELKLKKQELAYYQGVANWLEIRMQRGDPQYKTIRSGTVVLTDRRLIFIAEVGDSKIFEWRKILSVQSHGPNSFELKRESGKSPIIDVQRMRPELTALASQVAHRLWEDAQTKQCKD